MADLLGRLVPKIYLWFRPFGLICTKKEKRKKIINVKINYSKLTLALFSRPGNRPGRIRVGFYRISSVISMCLNEL